MRVCTNKELFWINICLAKQICQVKFLRIEQLFSPNCVQIPGRSKQKWIAVKKTSLTTTSLKKWRLEDVSICAPMLNLLSTRGPEVSFHSVLLHKNLKFSLDLNWILSDFYALFGRIDHRTPWQINRRRPTILTLSGGGHTFYVTRHPGGGL